MRYCSPVSSSGAAPSGTDALADCTACATGKFATGGDACQYCAVGYEATTTGLSACVLCLGGKSANASSNNHPCTACVAGEFAAPGDPLGCQKCPAGKAGATTVAGGQDSSADCVPCLAGKFTASPGLTACATCATAKYAAAGSTVCTSMCA